MSASEPWGDRLEGELPAADSTADPQSSEQSFTVIECPKSMVGRVIGKHGETIRALQVFSRALIQINQAVDPPQVTITGNPEGLGLARSMVHDIVRGEFKGFALLRQMTGNSGERGKAPPYAHYVGASPMQAQPLYAPGYGLVPPTQVGQGPPGTTPGFLGTNPDVMANKALHPGPASRPRGNVGASSVTATMVSAQEYGKYLGPNRSPPGGAGPGKIPVPPMSRSVPQHQMEMGVNVRGPQSLTPGYQPGPGVGGNYLDPVPMNNMGHLQSGSPALQRPAAMMQPGNYQHQQQAMQMQSLQGRPMGMGSAQMAHVLHGNPSGNNALHQRQQMMQHMGSNSSPGPDGVRPNRGSVSMQWSQDPRNMGYGMGNNMMAYLLGNEGTPGGYGVPDAANGIRAITPDGSTYAPAGYAPANMLMPTTQAVDGNGMVKVVYHADGKAYYYTRDS